MKEMNIIIEKQSPGESKDVINVYYKTWLDTYPNKEVGITIDDIEDSYKDSFTKENIEKSEERIRNMPENRLALVAKVDTKIVGVCSVIREKENNIFRTIYVLPEYQGQGIGKKLWERAKEFIDPKKETVVEVVDYNTGTIKFYESLGFVKTGKVFKDERFRMKSGAIFNELEMRRVADMKIT